MRGGVEEDGEKKEKTGIRKRRRWGREVVKKEDEMLGEGDEKGKM